MRCRPFVKNRGISDLEHHHAAIDAAWGEGADKSL